MRRVPALALALALAACTSPDEQEAASTESNLGVTSLAETVARLGAEAGHRSPGTQVAIAVRNLTTNEYAAFDDGERHVSASSAKVIWVAAAMKRNQNVDDIANPIFRHSDNNASGTAITRAGGADAVNQFMWDLGMDRSLLANWNQHHASNQGMMGGNNYFTAGNTTHFLTLLDRGEVLPEPAKSRLLDMMRTAPRTGNGGWLGTLLPPAVRDGMMHKAGWLPGPEFPHLATMNEIGIIQVPNGPRYAVSLLMRKGNDYWGKQKSFMEYASCEIYRSVARDEAHSCANTTLEFGNTPNTPMHAQPQAGSPVVDTLRTARSWFKCWNTGELHSGGNTTWYFTQGDDNGAWGYIPASAMETTSEFDANPSAHGMPKCP